MPCYHPLVAWRGSVNRGSGKRCIVFKRPDNAYALSSFKVPCGQCIGCRLERSRQWACRCVHEASMYEHNCFITLTYDTAHLPKDGSVSLYDFQCFMKRLRKESGKPGLRYFHCGEYGEKLGRPHYHACIFNFDFADKFKWSVNGRGQQLYRSPTLEKLWPNGFSLIGDVSFESAAYVARYVMKKVTGVDAPAHYDGRKPEYVTMSRRPGIGRSWYDKFMLDIFPSDFLVLNGVKIRPPKFYDGLYEVSDPDSFKKIKSCRVARSIKMVPVKVKQTGHTVMLDDNRDERLVVKEEVKLSRISGLNRSYEHGGIE